MNNEDNIREITYSWSFKTNMHKVANSLKLSDVEASSMLLDECLKRGVTTPLTSVMQWRVTYAQRDIVSNYYRVQKRDRDIKDKLSVKDEPRSLDNNLEDLNIDYKRLLLIIQSSFPNKKTQQFVQSVLDVGATQTMEDLGLTRKQFNRKLKEACDYASHHRGKFTAVIDQHERHELQSELALLQNYQLIINNRSNPEILIEKLIWNNAEYFEDFIGLIPNVSQCTLLRHYMLASHQDQYKLNEAINARLQSINKKLQSAENPAH